MLSMITTKSLGSFHERVAPTVGAEPGGQRRRGLHHDARVRRVAGEPVAVAEAAHDQEAHVVGALVEPLGGQRQRPGRGLRRGLRVGALLRGVPELAGEEAAGPAHRRGPAAVGVADVGELVARQRAGQVEQPPVRQADRGVERGVQRDRVDRRDVAAAVAASTCSRVRSWSLGGASPPARRGPRPRRRRAHRVSAREGRRRDSARHAGVSREGEAARAAAEAVRRPSSQHTWDGWVACVRIVMVARRRYDRSGRAGVRRGTARRPGRAAAVRPRGGRPASDAASVTDAARTSGRRGWPASSSRTAATSAGCGAPLAAEQDDRRVGDRGQRRDDPAERVATAARTARARALSWSPAAVSRRLGVDGGGARTAQAQLGEDLGEVAPPGRPGPRVSTCATSPASPPAPRSTRPSLTTARAEARRRGAGRRSRRGRRPARSRSARAAQLTSLSTTTGPSTSGARTATGSRLPMRNGASGRWTSRPVARSTGSAALTTASRVRRVAGRLGRGVAQRPATCCGLAGRSTWRSALGHDGARRRRSRSATTPCGAMLDDQRGADVGRQPVVGADAAGPGGALAGVAQQTGVDQPLDAARHRRLGDAGRRGELGPGHRRLVHQRAQHVLVGQRPQQVERRLGRGHAPQVSQDSCPKRGDGLACRW